MTLDRGSRLLIFRGHTFGKNSKIRDGGCRYRCSSALSKGCKAHVHVNKDDIIVAALSEHNHDPNKYMQVSDGRYVKL